VSFAYIRALVQQHSAIVLEDEKTYLAETRLLPLARREGFQSLNDLVKHLQLAAGAGLRRQVIEALTTNETSFFRDLHPFENMRRTLVPDLIRRRLAERRLSIWCAACSSGQEPYSVAMLLREHFPLLQSWDVRILASDLSTEMIDRARLGRYNQLEVNRGLPARLLVKFFRKDGEEWQVNDDLHRLVEFRPLNLIEALPPLAPFDLVLLRNVLIYFDVQVKAEVLGRVRRVLRPDGYLILGGAETTFKLDDAFERVPLDRASCYRMVQRQ
jgi:chemotaxis protein methyltransferase CheR